MIPSEFVLKSNTGAHLPIYFNKDFVENFLTEETKITVPTDDTGIYRINDRGVDLYKIDGIEFYKVNGTEVAVIVDQNNPMQVLDNILQSGLYSGYDGNVNPEVNKLMKRNKILKLLSISHLVGWCFFRGKWRWRDVSCVGCFSEGSQE